MSTSLQDKTQNQGKHFTFDKTFQEKIVQAMISDKIWAAQFAEVLDVSYFEHAYLKLVASKYVEYHKKFKEFPSNELLRTILVEELKSDRDSILRQQIYSFLVMIARNENLGDLPFVKDRALEFCRKQGLQMALEKSVELIVSEDYDRVATVIKEALAAGMTTAPGLSLGTDVEARYSETARNPIKTGIPELDAKQLLNGGLGAGEIGTVVALSGVGKSHILIQFGAEAIKRGKNVVHYSFELRERAMGVRYDSYLCDINSLECSENIQKIKDHYKENEETYGKLIIKEFPTRTATVQTLRNHLDRLALTGFRPDLVIVDYSGIMRSTEKYELPRMELQRIFEELRGLAQELNVPIWTATQSNKEGSKQDFIDMTNMAESYGQSHACDVIFGFHRKPEMKATGYGTLFIAKNRAGKDGIQFYVHLDTSKSKLKIISEMEPELAENATSGNNGGGNNFSSSHGNNNSSQSSSAISALRKIYKEQQKEKSENNPVKLESLA
jgi:replicative DNA helicase